MSKLLALTLSFILAGAAAQAQWRHDAGARAAVGTGSNGIQLAVDCANGDLPGLSIRNYRREVTDPMLVFSVDGGREQLIPTDCHAGICNLQFDSMDQPRQLIAALRRGRAAELGLYRMGELSMVPLTGSNAAIRQALRGCGG